MFIFEQILGDKNIWAICGTDIYSEKEFSDKKSHVNYTCIVFCIRKWSFRLTVDYKLWWIHTKATYRKSSIEPPGGYLYSILDTPEEGLLERGAYSKS